MAPLHRAIALIQVQNIAVLIAEDLDFDVLGAADVSFQENGIVAESGAGFLPRLFAAWRRGPPAGLDDAHAASAAAERSLDDQRKADLARDRSRFHRIG